MGSHGKLPALPLGAAHTADFCDKAFRHSAFCWVPAEGTQMLVKSFKHLQDIFFFSSKHSLYVNQYPQPILGNRTHHPLTGRRDKVIRERKVTEQVTGSDRHDLHRLFIRSLHTGGCKLTLTPLTSIPLRQCWDSQHGLFSLSLSPAQPSHNDPTPSISAPFWGV